MSLTYPLNLPATPAFRSVELLPVSTAGQTRSPFTGQQQIFEWPGQWLQFAVTLPAMKEAAAGDWAAFFMSLHGVTGTFLLGPSIRKVPLGVHTGTPLVNGGSQVGNTLQTDGWTASVTGIMKRGDWFQLGSGDTSSLHRVVQDANSNGSGQATLEIWPAPRTSPADNAALTLTNPKGLFRLLGVVPEAYDSRKICAGMSFTAVEAF